MTVPFAGFISGSRAGVRRVPSERALQFDGSSRGRRELALSRPLGFKTLGSLPATRIRCSKRSLRPARALAIADVTVSYR
jgi:hypothetical protein